jgi:outer membrane lipoprotein carrier protein
VIRLLLLGAMAWPLALPRAARAAGAPPNVSQLLADLEAASRDVKTLSAEFTQRNHLRLFKQELRSQGRLYFRRPRQIRWEYLSPDPSLLILDGDKATLTTPGAAPQVFDLTRDATMRMVFDQLLLWLGSRSLRDAEAQYELSAQGTATAPTLVLQPKAGSPVARAFTRIELRVDGKAHLLRGLLLVEKNGDEKEITFTKLERNAALPTDAFR